MAGRAIGSHTWVDWKIPWLTGNWNHYLGMKRILALPLNKKSCLTRRPYVHEVCAEEKLSLGHSRASWFVLDVKEAHHIGSQLQVWHHNWPLGEWQKFKPWRWPRISGSRRTPPCKWIAYVKLLYTIKIWLHALSHRHTYHSTIEYKFFSSAIEHSLR
jgi:hypothetical protein